MGGKEATLKRVGLRELRGTRTDVDDRRLEHSEDDRKGEEEIEAEYEGGGKRQSMNIMGEKGAIGTLKGGTVGSR